MAFGYGPDDISPALWLGLFTQVPLFWLLVSSAYRQMTKAWSANRVVVFGMLALAGSTALYNAMFPFRDSGGMTSGLLTLLLLFPLTILNGLVFTVRAFAAGPRGLAAFLTGSVLPTTLLCMALVIW